MSQPLTGVQRCRSISRITLIGFRGLMIRVVREGQLISLNFSHIWTHPALQGPCLLMATRGTTARIYPASLSERLCPPRHDGICALPPQHFDDLGRSL